MAGTKKLTLKNIYEKLKILKEQDEQISVNDERINKLKKQIIDDMKQDRNISREIIESRKCIEMCPFEDPSGACTFDRKYPTKLCSYQQTKPSEHNFEVDETVDVQDSAEEDMDDKENDHIKHFLAMVDRQNRQT